MWKNPRFFDFWTTHMLPFTESDNAELHETDIIAQTLFTKKHFCVIISEDNRTALPFGTEIFCGSAVKPPHKYYW